jgi:hypothetical protein
MGDEVTTLLPGLENHYKPSRNSLTLTLSQEEREFITFSPWEEGGDEGKRAAKTVFEMASREGRRKDPRPGDE